VARKCPHLAGRHVQVALHIWKAGTFNLQCTSHGWLPDSLEAVPQMPKRFESIERVGSSLFMR
jgi:hypothetical protein